jgi:hypothetical protein
MSDPKAASPAPQDEETRKAEARRRRSALIMTALAASFILVPFLFWRGTWFGRALTEEELGEYLADAAQPRHMQHALVQIGERMTGGDPTVTRWYPQIVELASSPHAELRITLAWVLGGDPRAEEFHRALTGLLQDPEPMVRRNAALSLVRFGDVSGREEILAMLRPFTVETPAGGALAFQLPVGTPAERGTLLARVETGQGIHDVQSPVSGTVREKLAEDHSNVAEGQGIVTLAPASEQVWEALRALYLVGRAEDLSEIERYARGEVADMPDEVQVQARATAEEIRRRSAHPSP